MDSPRSDAAVAPVEVKASGRDLTENSLEPDSLTKLLGNPPGDLSDACLHHCVLTDGSSSSIFG